MGDAALEERIAPLERRFARLEKENARLGKANGVHEIQNDVLGDAQLLEAALAR